jgi:ArsR family transcriptional regulator
VDVKKMLNKYVQFFKALSDETRQEILEMLEQEDMCVMDICGRFNMSQPTISHHLNILKNAGLVNIRKEGKMVFYQLRREWINGICREYFAKFKIEIE